MRHLLTVVLILSIFVTLSVSRKCMKTNGVGPKGPQPVKPCVFPFHLNGKVYNECTSDNDDNNKEWCSTEVDSNNAHQKGQWGYCDPECEEITGESKKESLQNELRCDTTDSIGPQKNESCIFPFTLRIPKNEDKTFDACTDYTDTDGKYWCSTKVDSEGIHQTGYWGYCDPNCSPKSSIRAVSTTPATSAITSTTSASLSTAATEVTTENGNYNGSVLPEYNSTEKLYCGFERSTGFIVGGVEAKQGAYPFIAALGVADKNRPGQIIYICGGSLINRLYVLTAAHCQSERDPIIAVRLGEHNFATDPDCSKTEVACKSTLQQFTIEQKDVTVHERFNIKTYDVGYDIALIRLPRPAITTTEDKKSRVLPVCLAWKNTIEVPTTNIHYVAGWGRSSTDKFDKGSIYDSGASTSILQQLKLPIVPFEECKRNFPSNKITDENHICAGGEPGKDSCSGDSGGPLVVKTSEQDKSLVMYLEGIVSFGSEKCNGTIPGIYTKVATFMPWILQNLKP